MDSQEFTRKYISLRGGMTVLETEEKSALVYLNESLSKPYKVDYSLRQYSIDAGFKTDDGRSFVITFLELNHIEKGIWDVVFYNTKDKFSSERFDVSGKGDAFRILSTVISVINHVIKSEKITLLMYTAKGDSRIRLYNRLLKLFPKSLKSKKIGKFRKDMFYGIARNTKDLDEYSDKVEKHVNSEW